MEVNVYSFPFESNNPGAETPVLTSESGGRKLFLDGRKVATSTMGYFKFGFVLFLQFSRESAFGNRIESYWEFYRWVSSDSYRQLINYFTVLTPVRHQKFSSR